MNRKIFWLVSGFLLSAMVVLGFTVAYAQQTPGRIVKFGAEDTLVDSIITESDSGNIGIGTAIPVVKLEVQGDLIRIFNTDGAMLAAFSTDMNSRAMFSLVAQAGSQQKEWRITNDGPAGGILVLSDLSGGGDRMVIDTSGNVGIGTITPDQLLSVNGNASKPGGGAWEVFSDERLKVIHGTFDAGLNEVLKLKPIRYRYNKDNPLDIRDEGEHIGLSAQEVQRVIPEAVTESRKGYLMLNSDPVLWAMLNAIKEQQKMIEELKKRASEIDGLRAQLNEMDELKAQVGKLQGLLQTVLAQRSEESPSDYVLTSGR